MNRLDKLKIKHKGGNNMNREQAKELLPIIQAFTEGKKIEYREKGEEYWGVTNTPTFNINANEYRIKPEPMYRPFKDTEECWQEMQKHQPFGWIKDDYEYKNIASIRIKGLYPFLRHIKICGELYKNTYDMSQIFRNYTFADGTPFGIKE